MSAIHWMSSFELYQYSSEELKKLPRTPITDGYAAGKLWRCPLETDATIIFPFFCSASQMSLRFTLPTSSSNDNDFFNVLRSDQSAIGHEGDFSIIYAP